MKKRSLCFTFSQKRHNTPHGSGGGGGGVVVVGTSSAPSSCGISLQAGKGGVSEGGGAALSTVGRGAASGVRGSGGDDDDVGVACAPSSWAKAATSMSLGERTFRFLAALVSLGDETRLPMWAAATDEAAAFVRLAADAATWS